MTYGTQIICMMMDERRYVDAMEMRMSIDHLQSGKMDRLKNEGRHRGLKLLRPVEHDWRAVD